MDFAPDKSDVKEALTKEYQTTLVSGQTDAMNALNDLDNYVSDQSKLHNTITLKSLLNRYSKAPYGFTNLDIQWLVATLFAQKRITLTINSEEVSLRETGAQKILDYLTKSEYFEKLLVSERDTISTGKIKAVKEVLKEVYDLTINFDNDERIMDEFKRVNRLKLDLIDNCLFEFKIYDKYPGKSILEESKELFNDANSKKNISQFYNFVSDNSDDFLDLADDLGPVLSFFQGSQKEIFTNSFKVYNVFEENKNLVNDAELSETAEKINKIISMSSPYSFIKDLPDLNKQFNDRFDEILEDKKTIILNVINGDLDSVLIRLTDEELKKEFNDNINLRFESLKNKLGLERNIAIINGITTESENLKKMCINEINKFIENRTPKPPEGGDDEPEPPEPPVIPIEKDVDIKVITQIPNVKLESEEKIDEFIEKLKSKLKEELKDVDIINLKLWGHNMVVTITKCLNEWNATIEALGKGKQSILIRKYGTNVTEFLLYPTVSYALKDNYLDSFQDDYKDFVKENALPNNKDSKFEVKYYAKVEKVIEKSSARIGSLNDYHIWTRDHVKSYLGNSKAQVWILRVYELDEPRYLSRTRGMRYANVDEEVKLDNLKPVLSDGEFENILKGI